MAQAETSDDGLPWATSTYINGDFSDLTIVLRDRKIRTHKLVLSRNSPVFSKMLKGSFVEGQKDFSVLKLKDDDAEALQGAIEFMYKACDLVDKFCHDPDRPEPIYYQRMMVVADKYNVRRLRYRVLSLLRDSFRHTTMRHRDSPNKVTETFELAIEHYQANSAVSGFEAVRDGILVAIHLAMLEMPDSPELHRFVCSYPIINAVIMKTLVRGGRSAAQMSEIYEQLVKTGQFEALE